MINTKVIKDLNPCQDRLDNWIKFYDNKDFTYAQFLGLKNITQEDKMWVCFRVMDPKLLGKCSADIAELALPIWEEAYPNDPRPRQAIEAARSGINAAYATSVAYAAYAYANAAANAAYACNTAANASAAAYVSTYYDGNYLSGKRK